MPIVEFIVPSDLGGAEEVVVVTWLKRAGDAVQAGEDLVILQAEKVSFDVPAPVTGVIAELVAKQGEVVSVGHLLARLEATEEISPSPHQSPSAEPVEAPSAEPVEAPSAAPSADQPVRASPIAKRLAREHGIDLRAIRGTGGGGRITEKDVQAAIESRADASAAPAAQEPAQSVRASPVAKRMAREHGVDLTTVQGSGSGGRITEKDVQAAIDAAAGPEAAGATELAPAAAVPFVGMRKTIAQRMHASLQESAQLTLHTEADVTDLTALYARLRRSEEISYTDLIVRACALALRRHPNINVRLVGDQIERPAEIHVGLAVALDLDEGLVVPVIRHADRKSIHEIAQIRRQLAQKARENRLTQEEMSGGTFTVTNLGNYGIDWFTPILNPPEAAILGVGRIIEKVVIHEGKIAQRWMMGLSLTIDHRLIDGAPGGAFLQSIAELLGHPEEL